MANDQLDGVNLSIPSGTYNCMVNASALEVTDSSGTKRITTPPADFKDELNTAISLQRQFSTPDGDTICFFGAKQHINITGGNYVLISPETGSEQIQFTQTSSYVGSECEITDPQTDQHLGRLKSQGKLITFLRRSSQFRWLISGTYTIYDSNDRIVGEVSTGNLSSKYTVQLQETAPFKNALIFTPILIHTFEKSW